MNRTHNSTRARPFPILVSMLVSVICLLAYPKLHAATLNLSDNLIKTNAGVAPNVLLTFDNSGSMNWYYLPDNIDGAPAYPRDASSAYNKIYYNPSITYEPGIDTSGNPQPSDFTAAWGDGYNTGLCTADLRSNYAVAWYNGDNCGGSTASDTGGANGAAYYFIYDESLNGCTKVTTDNSCYTQVIIDSSTPTKTYDSRDPQTGKSSRSDCADVSACTYSEESQNFANWYSYYRNRLLAAKTAVSISFWKLSIGIRIAFHPINPSSGAIPLFKDFSGTNKTSFISTVQTQTAGNSTPLREALYKAGQNFSTSGVNSPYAEVPGTTDGTEYSCRQNFNIIVTDGYWNGSTNFSGGNYDMTSSITLPERLIDPSTGPQTYSRKVPYADQDTSNNITTPSLADIAFYYWANDLRTLTNDVPPYLADTTSDYDGDGTPGTTADKAWNPLNDPATWQHMVTFTIGLGLNGHLTFDDADFATPFKNNSSWTRWPNETDQDPGSNPATYDLWKVDDLWHAAVNGRGHYFSATDPNALVQSFSNVLNNLATRRGSSSAVSTSSGEYQLGTSIFQTHYDGNDWSGDLYSKDVVTLNDNWHAADQMAKNNPNGSGRAIITYNPTSGNGIAFNSSSITTAIATKYGLTADVVNYLRGDQSKEVPNGGFRPRSSLLGDIIHSAPEYVGPPDRLFPDSLESKPYSTFKAAYASRTPMIWVGANDGMLHGFDASPNATTGTGGKELLAYVPYSVYPNLASLSKPSYSHKFFVDGSPVSRDAFYAGDWHTVLVGGLNNGGQGIYALDITNPATFTESNASSRVLWEFSDANDSDLGQTYGEPQIVKMNNGEWVAIFANGYNNTLADGHQSSTGDAVLYIVDIATGAVVRKFDTKVGMAQDPTGGSRPNGLAAPAVVDIDGNYTVDYIYAGDLFGNLWKFDVTDSNSSSWHIASAGGNPVPLFIATDASGNAQPITVRPVVGLHPSQPGLMIDFGTGKFLEQGDAQDTSVQSIYAVWDRMETTTNITTIGSTSRAGRTSLFSRSNLFTSTQFSNVDAGVTSNDAFDWYTGTGLPPLTGNGSGTYLGWYLDLLEPDGTAVGERVTSDPILIGNRLIVVSDTYMTSDPCTANSSSWITELNMANGMRSAESVFDYNGDGVIDSKDLVDFNGTYVVGTRIRLQSGGSLSGLTVIVDPTTHNEVKLSSTSKGGIAKVVEKGEQDYTGRRSWTQLLAP